MLQVFCCGSIWLLVSLLVSWRLIKISQQAFVYLKRLHQIPCSSCAFFTGDYRLKCTVHPTIAMSEEAIDCRDFLAKSYSQPHNDRTFFCSGCSGKKQNRKKCLKH
jgi:hypothetical protein